MRQQFTIDKNEVWRGMTMLMKKEKQSRLRSFRKFQGVSELSKASTRNPGGTYQGRIVMETSHKIGHNPKYAFSSFQYLFLQNSFCTSKSPLIFRGPMFSMIAIWPARSPFLSPSLWGSCYFPLNTQELFGIK